MRYLLDTSALLAHYRAEQGAEQVQALMASDDAEILAANVSIPELGRRLDALGVPQAEVDAVLDGYMLLLSEIVAIDAEIALNALALGRRTPGRMPLVDTLIAAAAQARQAVLVHRDAHLRAVPDTDLRQHDLQSSAEP